MAIFSPSEVTREGHALLAKVLAGKHKLRFTIAQAGDGHFDGDVMDLTELVNWRLDGRIVGVREMGRFTEIDCVITNQFLSELMFFREVCIRARAVGPDEDLSDEEENKKLDNDSVVFAYANAGDNASPMGPFNGVWLHEEQFTIRVYTANATNITAAIVPSTFATEIAYSGTASGLRARNVQAAIDEIGLSIGGIKGLLGAITGHNISGGAETFESLPPGVNFPPGTFFVVLSDETRDGQATIYKVGDNGQWIFVGMAGGSGFNGKFSFDGETLFNFINFGYFEGMPPGIPQAASPAIRGSALNLSPGSFSRPREIPHGDTLVFFEGFASFGEDETLILNNL